MKLGYGELLAFALLIIPLLLIPDVSSAAAAAAGVDNADGGDVADNEDSTSGRYTVIFDAGSTGSRVRIFRFGHDLQLLNIGDSIEVSMKIKPGLSSYASDPQQAANSLIPLLEKAKDTVPEKLWATTPVRLGATAGLRSLGADTSDRILKAVKDLLKNSSLEYTEEWVTILSGIQEDHNELSIWESRKGLLQFRCSC